MLTHKHHIIPRHAGGTNDPSNLIELTVAEHAEAHKVLFETHGRWQDKIAWHMLSGQILAEEATIQAIKMAQTGRIHTPEHRMKNSMSTRGKKRSDSTKEKIRNIMLNSPERVVKLMEGGMRTRFQKGVSSPKSEETKLKMSLAAKMRWNKTKVG
jgi:hypothetical protein